MCNLKLRVSRHSRHGVYVTILFACNTFSFTDGNSNTWSDKSPFIKKVAHSGKQLGKGSYGTVHEVEIDGRIYAAKVFRSELYTDDRHGRERFWEECVLLSSLHHPNIVQYHGICYVGSEPGVPRLLMERMNTSLHAYLISPYSLGLSFARQVSILCDVASGLTYLHTNKPPIIHRDLTAKNVLLSFPHSSPPLAKIADFGNARIADIESGEHKTMSAIPGTQVYMPPEACSKVSRYNVKLDIFSFGHLALFVTTHTFPDDLLPATFYYETYGRAWARNEVDRREMYFNRLHQLLSETHPLVVMIKKCLNIKSDQRPSADELLKQLQRMAPIDEPIDPEVSIIEPRVSSPASTRNTSASQESKSETDTDKIDLR